MSRAERGWDCYESAIAGLDPYEAQIIGALAPSLSDHLESDAEIERRLARIDARKRERGAA